MVYEVWLTLSAIVLLLVLSAFFNGSETALTASSRARMHALETEGNRRAKLVNTLLSAPEKLIGAVLLGNTLVDVLAAALAASLALMLVGDVGIVYATAILTILIVIFSAVLPKTYALAYPDRAALFVAPLMRAVVWLLTPVTLSVEFIVRQLLKFTPSKTDDAANLLSASREIRGTIQLQTREGTVAKGDAAMLGGVLDLRELQVLDIMIHRTKMTTVNADDPPQTIIDAVLSSQYTRMPVWKSEPENIVGILHTKDLLAALNRSGWKPDDIKIMGLATSPWFVPDTTSVQAQLNQFLKRKTQLALVVDEYGEVQGLITLEDILEEIVGQIADEYDIGEASIRPQPDGSVSADGTAAIRDLNRAMDWQLPDDEATTLAGLVMHEAQTIPEAGQVFTFYGYRFEIVRKMRNRITVIRVRRLGAKAALRPKAISSAGPANPG
jgi:Mg2+/Co2+ transporter CorB